MKNIIGLLIIAVIVVVIGTNVRGTIAEPATSTTAVAATSGLAISNAAATSALGTAVVIQQLTMCVLPLALLVVIGLGIAAFILWRRERAVAQPQTTEVETRTTPKVSRMADSSSDRAPARTPVRVVRKFRRSHHAARAAAKMFGK